MVYARGVVLSRNGIMFAALLLGSVVGQQAVHSQAEPKLANSPESLTPFIVKSAWLKFGIYDGRILAKDIRRTQSRSLTLYHDEHDAQEHLVVRTVPGQYRLKYAMILPEQTLHLEYDLSGTFAIRCEQDGDFIQLRQTGNSPIRVKLQRAGEQLEYSGQRLWLVLMRMPMEDRQQLIRLMNRLCPRTHVSLLFEESLAGLSRLSLTPVQVDLNKVRELVAMLDEKSYSVRQHADRQLRAFGRPLVGVLDNVDYSTLSTEQRTRLRLITKVYQVTQRDSVESIVATLKWSPQCWQALAKKASDPLMAKNANIRLAELMEVELQSPDSKALLANDEVLFRLR